MIVDMPLLNLCYTITLIAIRKKQNKLLYSKFTPLITYPKPKSREGEKTPTILFSVLKISNSTQACHLRMKLCNSKHISFILSSCW